METMRSDGVTAMEEYAMRLQDEICRALEARDGGSFGLDRWQRPGGGGGLSRVLQDGPVLEKAGVNVSTVWGRLHAPAAARLGVQEQGFAACGLSLVIHPRSPRVPSAHMNVRYFETDGGDAWYGGGADLTPYHPHTDDFRHFHRVLRDACERVQPGSYAAFKAHCDEYFTIGHRREMRGIGGVFFDYLRQDLDRTFQLVRSVGDAFLPAYAPLMDRRKDEVYEEEDRRFQLVRRGRYAEFNLVYDRGTRFGLQTEGRVESVLMSLPPLVRFVYDYVPRPGSKADEMTRLYQPHDWAG